MKYSAIMLAVGLVTFVAASSQGAIIPGSTFGIVHGGGNTTDGFFGYDGGSITDVTIDGAPGGYATIFGGNVTVTATLTQTPAADTLVITMTHDGAGLGEFFPLGISVGGAEFDLSATFLGPSGALNPLQLDALADVNNVSSSLEVFSGGSSLGTINIAAGAVPITGGSYGINWGNLTGLGVDELVQTITVANIPEPATLALLGMGSLVMLRRRRVTA